MNLRQLSISLMFTIMLTCMGTSRLFAHIEGFSLLNGASSVRIPVSIQNNVILLCLRINGSFEMNFILDTGVKTTLLTEPVVAGFLQIDSLVPVNVRGLGKGEQLIALLAREISMQLPGVTGNGINMLVLPEGVISYSGMFGKPVYGIIGYEIFRQFVVRINYQQEFIELHDPFKYNPPRGKRWTSLPITLQQSKPYVNAKLTDGYGNKVNQRWLIDTGASMGVALFNDELPVPDPSVPAFLGQGISGDVHGDISRNPEFSLGPYAFQDVITAYPDSQSLVHLTSDINWYGNIGSDILSRFHVVLDYLRKRVYLKRNLNYKKPFSYNMSGLEFISGGPAFDTFIITYVRPNSPAEAAGIKVNDQVISLNGKVSDEMNIEQIYGNLSRGEGRRVWIKLRRGSEVIKASFKLQSEI